MTEEQEEKCHAIIHSAAASGAAAAGGLAQLPGSDNVVLVSIEVAMIIALGSVFEKSIDESTAKGIIAGGAGTLVGRGVSQFLVGWIPVVGNLINASTAAGVVELLGWAVVKDFDNSDNSTKYIA